MSDQNENVCPYCGGKVVAGFTEFRGVQGYQARCFGCGAAGPVIIVASEVWHIEIVDAFCHPAHLLEGKTLVGDGLRTYNPRTHIVVSRECAGDVLGLLDAWADRLNAVEHKPTWGIVPDFDPSVTELRAALEGESC